MHMHKTKTHTKSKRSPWKRGTCGRHRQTVPRVVLAVEGVPVIHEALRERYGSAPSYSTLLAVLYGRRDNEAIVRAVAEMFPAAILPAVAEKYGIEIPENGGR